MSSVSFSEIYSSFFTKVEGYDLFDPNLSEETRNEFLCSYLHSALSDRYVSQLFSSLTVTDPVTTTENEETTTVDGSIEYTLKYQNDSFVDDSFVREVLGYGMALAWITPKVNSLVNTQMLIGTVQDKWYSQANHISSLKLLKDDIENKRNHLIADRGVINNDYLDGNSTISKMRDVT